MTTNELKSYIDRTLGDSIRCLLPSYWWKKMFGAVVDKLDEKVDTDKIATINGQSLVEGGNVTIEGGEGEKGDKGDTGVGITSVVQTTTSSADGGSNVVTVTLSDGKTSTFTVKNGSKGTQGEKGADGAKGDKGDKGDTGATGPQGNSGYTGAASELEVVNNLTQGGEASALSAEQGKVLDTKLTELSAEVSAINETIGLDSYQYIFASAEMLVGAVNPQGQIVSYGKRTEPIEFKKGDKLVCENFEGTPSYCLASEWENGVFVKSLFIPSTGGKHTFSLEIEKDMSIIFSNGGNGIITINRSRSQLVNDINTLTNRIDAKADVEEVESISSELSVFSGLQYTDILKVPGQTITKTLKAGEYIFKYTNKGEAFSDLFGVLLRNSSNATLISDTISGGMQKGQILERTVVAPSEVASMMVFGAGTSFNINVQFEIIATSEAVNVVSKKALEIANDAVSKADTALENLGTINGGITTNGVLINQGIMMLGASFASGVENNWFAIFEDRLKKDNPNLQFYDKTLSSSNVMYEAVRLYQNTLFTSEEFENFDVLLIDHVHDKDVFTLKDVTYTKNGQTLTLSGSQLKDMTAEQYETSGLIDYFDTDQYDSATGANRKLYLGYRSEEYYAAAYDYIIKKYRTLCYAARNNANSRWYCKDTTNYDNDFRYGKPCQIVFMTHWNGGRAIINESLKRLANKWYLPCIELQKELGLSAEIIMDKSNGQSDSSHYARDGEFSETYRTFYGKHMVFSASAPYPIVQQKVAKVLYRLLSY